MGNVLPFNMLGGDLSRRQVGKVHRDGSITFRDRTYATVKELPPACLALRPDLETHRQWRALYRAIDPRMKRRRYRPRRP